MTSYLILTVYEDDSDLNGSDQITVPAEVWTVFDRDHMGDSPIFVDIGGAVGRLRPAVPSDVLTDDSCRVPRWLARRLGYAEDEESWTLLSVCQLPTAGTLVLRARREADLTESPDPVAMLTAALSGTEGQSWSCLSVGSELPLPCGTFDVMEIRTASGDDVPAACILNCDVNLEFAVALDQPGPERFMAPAPAPAPAPAKGFVPFSGAGNRLGRL
jgi:hypothetical protein